LIETNLFRTSFAVYYLEKGLGIADVNDFLDAVTGGTVTSLEKALGVTDLEAALGIAP